jgi:hypothetical protein
MTSENWYIENKPRILREIKFAIPHYRKFIAKAFGPDFAESVVAETIQRFEVLLPCWQCTNLSKHEGKLSKRLLS